MDLILFSEMSIKTTLAVKLKSPWLTAVIELLDMSTLLRREKWVRLAGTAVSNCPEIEIVSRGTACCGLSNFAIKPAIMLLLISALPLGHSKVSVEMLPLVSGQTHGEIDDGVGQSHTIGLMAVRKGVLLLSLQVGAPLVDEM